MAVMQMGFRASHLNDSVWVTHAVEVGSCGGGGLRHAGAKAPSLLQAHHGGGGDRCQRGPGGTGRWRKPALGQPGL